MPQMDPARWRAASLRLDEALELTEDQRPQWMAALHEQDPRVADDVQALLDEFDVMHRDGFLDGQCRVRPGEAAGDPESTALPPRLTPELIPQIVRT